MTDNDDLDWLYRRDQPDPDQTRAMPPAAAPSGGYPPPALKGVAEQPGGYPPAQQYPPRQQQQRPAQQAPRNRPPGGQPPASPPRSRRRKGGFSFLRTVTFLLIAWLVYLVAVPVYAWTMGTKVDAAPDGDRPAEQPGRTILLVGSDSRDDLTPEEREQLQTGSVEGRRTDTMLLLYIPPSGKSALISLPRDSYVAIPGHGNNKLNAAYAYGGAPLLVETIEVNTGVRVDGYLEVGFLGLVEVVDAVGGIEVCLDEPIQDQDSHLDLPAGCQTLDGVTTLGYVRMRKADPRGDLGRIERQREVIGKVAAKALSPLSLVNPVRYWQLNMAAAKSLSRGEATGVGDFFSVVRGFLGTATGDGLSLTVPVADPGASTDAGSAVIWDEAKSQEMFDAIASGDSQALEQFQE
ncbi:MAG: LCP family protein [Arachnia sp.]